jgi:DcuC family C4-dicarboxylate transporter
MRFGSLQATPRAAAILRRWCLAALILLAAAGGLRVALASSGPEARVAAAPTAAEPGSSTVAIAIAAVDVVAATVLVALGTDVRLVLLAGAVPMFAAAGGLPAMLGKMVAEMANPGTVVPICSAVGFAFVLRVTGCDQHLVQLLLHPVRRVRLLLVPGGIAAGYLLNSTIVSQAGTAAVLGPILIPLLRAGGIGPARSGAILLLGASMGGELFNPGAVEMRKLAELTRQSGALVVAQSARLNLAACTCALLAFWLLALRRDRGPAAHPAGDEPARTASSGSADAFRINLFKAVVPLLPLLLLSCDSIVGSHPILGGLEGPPRILAAMLIGVTAAGLASPKSAKKLAPSFFEGAGYAYHHVIALIIVASTYAEGVRASGLIGVVIHTIAPWPNIAMLVSLLGPWGLAVVCGSGIAPAVSVMEFFVPAAQTMGLDPIRLGTISALGAHFGRTMSPAAAVVMVSSSLSGSRPSDLIRLVAPALAAGGLVLLTSSILGLF